MNRRQAKRRAAIKDFFGFVAVVVIMVGGASAFLTGCFYWFEKVDCYNATEALDFIERCEANEDCKLRPHDLNLKESMTRLQIKSCPKD